jgi:hypothetical protein
MVSREDGANSAYGDAMVAALKDHTDHDAITQWATSETLPPGSEILTYRKIEERPYRDFLMHQQGFLSGKTEGDLESVPGYYGGTASYKFVQNAQALNQMRVTRYKLSRELGEHHDEYGRVVSDKPAAKLRAETLAVAKAVPFVPYSSVGPDMAYKEAGEYGAFLGTYSPFRPDKLPYDLLRSARAPYGMYGGPGAPGAFAGPMKRYGGYGANGGYGGYGGYGGFGGFARPGTTLQQRLNPTKTRAQIYNEINRVYPAGTAAAAEAAADAAGAFN